MRAQLRYALLAAIGMSLMGPATAEIGELHVVGDRTFYPYEFCSFLSNSARGILVDQWRLMASKSRYRVHYTCDDWAAAQEAVVKGQADAIGGMIKSPDRETKYQFIAPLVQNPAEYYYFRNSTYKTDPAFPQEVAAGTKIGVVKGDYAVEWLTNRYSKIRLEQYGSYEDVVKAAHDDQINLFVMEESISSHHLNQFGIQHLFTRGSSPLFQEWLWATVEKSRTGLAAELKTAFAKVPKEEFAVIELRWSAPQGLLSTAWIWVEPIIEDNFWYVVIGTAVVVYMGTLLILYLFFPLVLYRISRWLAFLDIQLNIWPISRLPVRNLLVLGLFDSSSRLAIALLTARRDVIIRNFTERRTVRDRGAHYPNPYIIDGERIEFGGPQERKRQLADRLKKIYGERRSCVEILGDGGSGKTSLACWIARNALALPDDTDEGQASIFASLTVPIIVEGSIDQDLTTIMLNQMRFLFGEEIPATLLTTLIRNNRIVVIIDGLSEMTPASHDRITSLDASGPPFMLLVTARREENLFGGTRVHEIRRCNLSKSALAGFLEFLLKEIGHQLNLNNINFFDGCSTLSKLVKGSQVPPIVVVIYVQLLASGGWKDHLMFFSLKDVPDLFWGYVNRINSSVRYNRVSDPEVLRYLRTVAWACVSTTLQPTPCSRTIILRALEGVASPANAFLGYLEDTLSLVETLRPAQTQVRFVLDPLAEYLAAAYLLEEGRDNAQEWGRVLSILEQPGQQEACHGFWRALSETANSSEFSKVVIPAGSRERLERLREQGNEAAAQAIVEREPV